MLCQKCKFYKCFLIRFWTDINFLPVTYALPSSNHIRFSAAASNSSISFWMKPPVNIYDTWYKSLVVGFLGCITVVLLLLVEHNNKTWCCSLASLARCMALLSKSFLRIKTYSTCSSSSISSPLLACADKIQHCQRVYFTAEETAK